MAEPGEAQDAGSSPRQVAETPADARSGSKTRLSRERDEYLDLAQRARAELENYRKRTATELGAAERRGRAAVAREVLPALDNLERALLAAGVQIDAAADGEEARSEEVSAADAFAQGVALVLRELRVAIARAGSPARSDRRALRSEPPRGDRDAGHDGADSGTCVETLERGYCSATTRSGRPGSSSRNREKRWRPATITQLSVSSERPRPTKSRRPTAGWPASTTRTATPATRRPRSASSRSSRPTTRSRIPTSDASTTRPGCSAAADSAASARRGGGFGADLGDIFSSLFGRGAGGGAAQAARGRDLETDVRLSFDQAMNGAQISVTVPKQTRCETCSGSGAKPGTSPVTCPQCGGRGIDAQSQGVFSISQPCARCGGRGEIVESPCPRCSGTGLTQERKRYRVNIPAGVRDGTRIRLAGRGEDGPFRRPAGRPLRYTRVTSSPVFTQRPDGNLEVRVPVTVAEAVQGATIEVPTLRGSKRIKIAPGTEHGTSTGSPARVRRNLASAAEEISDTGSRSTFRRVDPTATAGIRPARPDPRWRRLRAGLLEQAGPRFGPPLRRR